MKEINKKVIYYFLGIFGMVYGEEWIIVIVFFYRRF